MTRPAETGVVRRSALEADHLALGAQWHSGEVHWPEAYAAADATADAKAVGGGAGLAEVGPFEELLLRGPGAVAAAGGVTAGGGAEVGRLTALNLPGTSGAAWFLGPDEVLLVGSMGAFRLDRLAHDLSSEDVSAIEMSGARTSLRLVGPAAPAILAELCAADTTPAAMAPTCVVQAPLAGVRAFIARVDTGAHPGYSVMIARDEASFVWQTIVRIGSPHGLTPVGPAAVLPEGSAPK